MTAYGMCQYDDDRPCYSPVGLAELAYRTPTGALRGPMTICATHRRSLSRWVMEWVDPATALVEIEEDRLARRDEQDAEDIIDSDGRLLPRGLR